MTLGQEHQSRKMYVLVVEAGQVQQDGGSLVEAGELQLAELRR